MNVIKLGLTIVLGHFLSLIINSGAFLFNGGRMDSIFYSQLKFYSLFIYIPTFFISVLIVNHLMKKVTLPNAFSNPKILNLGVGIFLSKLFFKVLLHLPYGILIVAQFKFVKSLVYSEFLSYVAIVLILTGLGRILFIASKQEDRM